MKIEALGQYQLAQLNPVSANNFRDQESLWKTFAGLWERSSLIRNFLWVQHIANERSLLRQFLVRLRRFFASDFCFANLLIGGDEQLLVGAPNALVARLSPKVYRRCLEMVASARASVAFKVLPAELGYRSLAVAPISQPQGNPLGFVTLAQRASRSFSSAELAMFDLLAGELSWALRDLRAQKAQQKRLAAASHDLRNLLQSIFAHAGALREICAGALGGPEHEQIRNIEARAEEIAQIISALLDRPRLATAPLAFQIRAKGRLISQEGSNERSE